MCGNSLEKVYPKSKVLESQLSKCLLVQSVLVLLAREGDLDLLAGIFIMTLN